MKKLYVVRHAKSDWENASEILDIDRPLNTRGVRNAYEMAARFKAKALIPDAIIASNGIRALHTAVIFSHQIGFETSQIIIHPELYHASPNEILKQIKAVNNDVECLMLFAHNPGISEFASFVDKRNFIDVATCGLLEIELLVTNWKDVDFDNMNLLSYDFPKNIVK